VRPDARVAAGAVGVSGLASVTGVAVLLPDAWATLTSRVTGTLIRTDAIAETDGLFADSAGWLLLFGFVLFLAVPYLLWGTRGALDADRWVVPVAYAWAFFGLAVLQIRFVGEFASFAALFAGLGFVHLAERVDVTRLPRPFSKDVDGSALGLPDRRQVGALVVLFLLVGGLGLVQVPIKTNQVTTPGGMYETAAWMDDYTETAAWDDRPEYVFSQWGHNRMYNYHVSGESRSYGFARSNYGAFLGATNETEWYDRLHGRTGFIVYQPIDGPAGSITERLAAYGSRTENASGLAHYRAVHVSEDEAYRVFTLVPGATITGTAEPNATVTVTTTLEVSGQRIEYERQVPTGADGAYSVTVPYPGSHEAAGATVEVSEAAVLNGTRVAV
jgi:dolichyl-diphosphooligosaccharide--protein glycosyltransferase